MVLCGIVWLVEHKNKEQLFAFKVIKLNLDKTALKLITQELKINHSLECPYVVKYYESFYANGEFSILMEYMDCGTWGDLRKKAKKIPEKYLAAISKQVLEGLSYLNHHEKHIIHRDLKPSNLLINQRGEAKIGDFGVSATVAKTYGQASTYMGTSYYVAPERIEEQRYDHKSDIWSLGLVFLKTVVNQEPPRAPSNQFSPAFCFFISSCLKKKPEDRKSARQLLEDPFLKKYESQRVDLSAFFRNVLHSSETFEAIEKSICPESAWPFQLESKEEAPTPKRKSNIEQATSSPRSMKIKYMGSEVGVSSKRKDKEVTDEPEKVVSSLSKKSSRVNLQLLAIPPQSVVQSDSESVRSIVANVVMEVSSPKTDKPIELGPNMLDFFSSINDLAEEPGQDEMKIIDVPKSPPAPIGHSNDLSIKLNKTMDRVRAFAEQGLAFILDEQQSNQFLEHTKFLAEHSSDKYLFSEAKNQVKTMACNFTAIANDIGSAAFFLSEHQTKQDELVHCKATLDRVKNEVLPRIPREGRKLPLRRLVMLSIARDVLKGLSERLSFFCTWTMKMVRASH
ncbi:serine/threonine-protein kinase svkA isoform X1 [Jatropha curcas]|uniref:serine/threonine-protein kinase svkA isoform X1 n=1 Tax=Jatropha curcas TaxID=180498 RepID=UPI001894CD73|nr:serine/threonine-protein kinase svkA isoform X1 [Jatropha curcas]